MKKTPLLLALVILPGVLAHDGPNVIHMKDDGYEPRDLEIFVGETVEFENEGQNMHWPASNVHPTHEIYSEFDPKDIVQPGETWRFRFTKPGVWRYHDHAYPEITGKITVKRNPGDAPVESTTLEPTAGLSALASVRKLLALLFPNVPDGITGLVFAAPVAESATEPPPAPFAAELLNHTYNPGITEDDEAVFSDDNALFSYVKKYGVKKATDFIERLDAKYGDCHQRSHRIGRYGYALLNSEIFKQCDIRCHSGCYHGAIEAYFRDHGTEDIPSALNTICGEKDNDFFAHQCFHGIGHGLTAWADYDILEALESCDYLTVRKASCYTGVFMENVVGSLEDGAHKTKYLSDDPHFPCNAVNDTYKGECYFFQTARMKQLFDGNYQRIGQECGKVPEQYQYLCFSSMGRDASGDTHQNPEQTILLCQNAPAGPHRIECMKGGVQDTFWDPKGQDTALRFCRLLKDPAEKTACYGTIFGRAPEVILTRPEIEAFCAKVEQPFLEQCTKHVFGKFDAMHNDVQLQS